jgi:hypothetical protein
MSVRLVALILSLPLLMGSEIYRYVDANGVVTYAQQLPYGVKGEQIKTMDGAPTVAVQATAPQAEKPAQPVLTPQQQAMLDDLKKAEQARKEEIARIREANCTRSKDVLERLSSAGRIRVKGPDGQEVKMPEEERQSRIEEAQRGIVTNCAPTAPTEPSAPAVANANSGG